MEQEFWEGLQNRRLGKELLAAPTDPAEQNKGKKKQNQRRKDAEQTKELPPIPDSELTFLICEILAAGGDRWAMIHARIRVRLLGRPIALSAVKCTLDKMVADNVISYIEGKYFLA